jgi:bacteriocin biosynthesis cyclodehydratase domain-containing protein
MGLLGPTIIPYQTACYTCYDRRVRSQADDLRGFIAYRDRVTQLDGEIDEGMLSALGSVLAGQVALEAARLLAGFAPPVTVGRFYEFSVLQPEATGHDVLRVPRCPSCRKGEPLREAWDQAFAVAEALL